MKEIGDEYRSLVTPFLKPQRPRVPFMSSVTGGTLSEAQEFGPEYWQRNLENPVLFRQAVSRLLRGPSAAHVHLEVGPHSALAGPLKQIYDENGLQVSYTSVLRRASNDSCALLAAVGHLHCLGTMVRLPVPDDDHAAQPLTDLPPYPWDLSRTYWPEGRALREWQAPRAPEHELLGQRVRQVSEAAPQWRCALSLESVPWIADHRIRRNAMFPAAAYIAMAGEVAHQLTGTAEVKRGAFVLRDLHIQTALVMHPGQVVEMVTEARPEADTGLDESAWWEVSIRSFQSGQAEGDDGDGIWTEHCSCRVRAAGSQKQSHCVSSYKYGIGIVDGLENTCVRRADPATWYKAMARVGYNYGPRFRGAHDIRTSARSKAALVRVALQGSQDSLLENDAETGHPGSRYAVHPTTIDHVLQAMIVAAHGGQTSLLEKLWLPVRIDEVFVGQEHVGDFQIMVKASSSVCGDAVCRVDSQEDVNAAKRRPISYFRGVRLAPVESLESGGTSHGAIELVWKPDIDLISPSALVQRAVTEGFEEIHSDLHELFTLCALDLQEKLPPPSGLGLGPSTADSNLHLAKQYDWLNSYTADQDKIPSLDSGQAPGRIETLARKLKGTSGAAAASLVMQCHTHAQALFGGDANPLDLFLQDNALHHLYDWMNSLWSYRCLLQLLSHQRGRNLKILEIGAGTGGLTARVLRDLKEEGAEETGSNSTTDERATFGKYVFTDVSAGFFPAAKKRFATVVPPQLMEYRVLDISRPPQEQGFGTCEYDLVIASNALHATPNLTQTLRHVRTLLRPDGRLLLQELACGVQSKWINFVMGFLPGWWLGHADMRANEPYLAPEHWHHRLVEAGFDSPELVALDADAPLQLNATILARPGPVTAGTEAGVGAEAESLCSDVTLLVPPECEGAADNLPAAVRELEGRLQDHGHRVSRVSMGQPLDVPLDVSIAGQKRHFVVSAIDLCLQDGWFHDLTEEKLAGFQHLTSELQAANAGILWLTQPCQIRPRNPSFAQCLGIARTVRAELGVRFATLELDFVGDGGRDDTSVGLEHVIRAIQSFIQKGLTEDSNQTSDGAPGQDMELAYYSVAKGIVIPRARPVSIRSAIHSSATDGEGGCIAITKLRAARPGSLEGLEWTAVPRTKSRPPSTTPLPSGAVRVRVQAAGLNFKDVMVAMGILGVPGSEDGQNQGLPLGCEAAGVVTAVGTSVVSQQRLSVGDRVAVFAPQAGCFSTEVDVDARLCARIPEYLSMSEAAGMPCVFTTVLRGLADKAGLAPGQTVLIHSGAGGVGLAAIQVAQHLGVVPANIYATAGSNEKRKFLAEQHGLPPGNIFSSRDDSFVDGIMAATRGRGVDVVLNSLSGDLLHASWGCVAGGGTLVELGKRDVLARGRLAMAPFDDNRSFVAVDMARLAVQDPSVVGRLLEQTLDLYKQKAIAPVQPLRLFGFVEVEDAFRQLSKPSHVGKVVVDMSQWAALKPKPKNGVSVPMSVPVPAPELDPEAVYLLVGGLGGLGTSISRWMASHGAKSLAILSRSGGESEAASDVPAELLEMGCKVTTVVCDVTDEDGVREAISQVSSNTQRPIAGVLFLPMVLADAALSDMTISKWRAATDPKIRGSWNIHNSLPQSSHLDFFVLFGSTSGFCGYPGQANYAAANSFLDAFAQYRRRLGLPCSVIDIGPVEDVGHVSKVKEIQDTMARSGARFVSERQMLEAVQLAMLSSTVTPSQGQGWGIDRGLLVRGQLGVGFDVEIPLEDARNSVVWKRDARMVMLRPNMPGPQNSAVEPGASSNGLTDFISHLRSEPTELDSPSTLTLIAREIASRLFSLLSRELDQADEGFLASVSLESLGIDSLMTIEVRNWWKRTFCSQISSMQLVNAGNFLQLAALAITQLKEAITR